MTVAVAFKTKQPALISDYLEAREVTVAGFHAKVDAFKATIGGKELFGTSMFDGGFLVAGYRAEKYGEDLPAGWRHEGSRLDVVPAKRTPEGKEHAKALAALYLPGNSYPGCPEVLHAENHLVFPRVDKVGEDYYLTLSKVPIDRPANTLDPDIWEPVKLSEYHAALEAAELVSTEASA
jgi:hypothetical protein